LNADNPSNGVLIPCLMTISAALIPPDCDEVSASPSNFAKACRPARLTCGAARLRQYPLKERSNIHAGTSRSQSKEEPESLQRKICVPWAAPHGGEQIVRTKDATDTKAREPRSRGCFVVVLYNNFRPHSSLGYQTPAVYAGPIAATGSKAAQYESLAFPPVAINTLIGVVKTAEALIAVG